jgi:uncharacterized protein (TIGR02996 family)
MTHPDAFLKDILRQPGLDEPRLRYADWLEGHCHPLGEFIRIQIRLPQLPCGDARLFEMERREHELLAEFEYDWVGDLPERVQWWGFRRGFVEEVALPAARYVRDGQVLFERFPIQEIHLQDVAEQLAALTSSARLACPRHLDLSNNRLGDIGAGLLSQSAWLQGLASLNLSCTGIGSAGAEALATSSHLAGLRDLYLTNNRISDSGARALADSRHLGNLDRLFLDYNPLGFEGDQVLRRRFGKRVVLGQGPRKEFSPR